MVNLVAVGCGRAAGPPAADSVIASEAGPSVDAQEQPEAASLADAPVDGARPFDTFGDSEAALDVAELEGAQFDGYIGAPIDTDTTELLDQLVDVAVDATSNDAELAVDATVDILPPDTSPAACPAGATATSSHPTLVAMPVKVQLTASFGGKPCQCQWASTTPAVCAVTPNGTAKKVGDGICAAQCTANTAVAASIKLEAASQWLIYYVGGFCEDAPWAEAMPCGAKLWRWRSSDNAWDVDFAQLPEVRDTSPVVFARGHSIWVGGGFSHSVLDVMGFEQAGGWKQGSVAPKCPEALHKDLGGTAEEKTCRAFRRLNLDTGEWDSPFEWKHPRSQTLYTDTGGLVWLSHGGTLKGSGFPLPWAGEVIDPQSQVTYNMAIPATATYWPQGAPSALWGDAIVQGSYSTLAMLDAKTLTKFQPFPDADWPCKWNSIYSMTTFPGTNTLMIYGSGKKAPCPAVQYINPQQPLLEWIQPLLYTPGNGWSVGDHLPEATGRLVAAGDKLYFASNGGIMRLDSPTGKWKWMTETPKQPIYRTGYNVVAVWQ